LRPAALREAKLAAEVGRNLISDFRDLRHFRPISSCRFDSCSATRTLSQLGAGQLTASPTYRRAITLVRIVESGTSWYVSMRLDKLNRTIPGRPGFDNSERSYSSATSWVGLAVSWGVPLRDCLILFFFLLIIIDYLN